MRGARLAWLAVGLAVAGLAAIVFVLRRPAGSAAVEPAASSASAAPAAAAQGFSAIPGVEIRFARVEEGRAVLGAPDAWSALTSNMQRAALMDREPPVPVGAFLAWQADAVRPWSDAQRERWLAALGKIAPAFERLKIPLPAQVLLVASTGRESENTPHTRGNAVVLPAQFDQQAFSDVEVLAHELFHVATRHRPELATRLYAAIGFAPCGELQWPPEWEPLRIADHDAPHHRHFMTLKLKGRAVALMPVVVAAKGKLDRAAGETIVGLMQTRLLEVVPGLGGAPTWPVLAKGRPVWHDGEGMPEYLAALGGNTDYSIHPEETMADNLMFIVSGRKVPHPELLRRIEALLLAAPVK